MAREHPFGPVEIPAIRRDSPELIVAGLSSRALARSARLAGYTPLAIDVFGDDDTRDMSEKTIVIEGGPSHGVAAKPMIAVVDLLLRDHCPLGFVYGSGFEHQPEVIAAIARQTPVIGNDAATLRRVKDARHFAEVCAAVDAAHPPISHEPSHDAEGWLVKRTGGAGGLHVRAVGRECARGADVFFQRRVAGEAISALFIANAQTAEVLGLSAQWTSPAPSLPYRYGGAVGPIEVGANVKREIARVVARLAREFRLVGLNSADLIVSAEAVWIIEINPRPGATLDVFDSADDPLLARHVAACEGRIIACRPRAGCRAAEIVYARHNIVAQIEGDWPSWTADRPARGMRVGAGDPLCTVLAAAESAELARSLAGERARRVIAMAEEWKA